MNPEIEHPKLNDSKQVRNREYLGNYIQENAIDYAAAYCDQNEIDEINILKASHLEAIDMLNIEPELLLNMFTNYLKKGDIIEHQCIIKGGKYASISAASILAKTYHDDYIENLLRKSRIKKKRPICARN